MPRARLMMMLLVVMSMPNVSAIIIPGRKVNAKARSAGGCARAVVQLMRVVRGVGMVAQPWRVLQPIVRWVLMLLMAQCQRAPVHLE
jgi:hypothetical protein